MSPAVLDGCFGGLMLAGVLLLVGLFVGLTANLIFCIS